MNFLRTIVAAGLVAASASAFAADITGAGATFPFPIYSKWADAYKKETGNGLNYQSIGSGAGIKQIQAKTVTFGATDAPLKFEQLEKDGLVQWPMVMGAIVPVVNLEGIKSGELVLSGEVLGDIYLGKITKWNDAAIARDNKDARLPDAAIAVAHRSDGSGTTAVFTDYLAKVSPEWKAGPGAGKSVSWPAGLGGKGNEGVTGIVKQTEGAIGYVELAYANQNKLTVAELRNREGKYVKPSLESVSAAAEKAEIPDDYRISITDAPGGAAYPISAFTYLLVYRDQPDPAKGEALVRFLWWAAHDGQKTAPSLDYAPLPKALVHKVEGTLKKLTVQGKAVLAASK